VKLATNWIENDGRSPGLMLAHAHGWGTILDVELRDGTVELEMPAWVYEFAMTGGPKDVLRYRVSVKLDREALGDAMKIAERLHAIIRHNKIDMTVHGLGEVVAGYLAALRRCDGEITKMLEQLEKPARPGVAA